VAKSLPWLKVFGAAIDSDCKRKCVFNRLPAGCMNNLRLTEMGGCNL